MERESDEMLSTSDKVTGELGGNPSNNLASSPRISEMFLTLARNFSFSIIRIIFFLNY